MMSSERVPMLDVLRNPASAVSLAPDVWGPLIGTARHSNLLPRLALLLEQAAVLDSLPDRVRRQLRAAAPMAHQHERTVRWEVSRIQAALSGLDTRVILLKGAAYVMAELPAGTGRLATDVDILVPKADLRAVEQALLAAGWAAVKLHPYDQRFYREWSHELPPLRHVRRKSVLDVHHNILPIRGRIRVDAEQLLAAAIPLEAAPRDAGKRSTEAPGTDRRSYATGGTQNSRGLWMLCPEDMVLHSAAHLFQDGELAGSVRDLVDADALLTDFGERVPGFWDRLPARARTLGLERPLFYVLRFARRLLDTPVPASADAALAAPPAAVVAIMDRLASRALLPVRGQHGSFGEETARMLLYARSHWLRMPPALLVAHLTRKAVRRWGGKEEGD